MVAYGAGNRASAATGASRPSPAVSSAFDRVLSAAHSGRANAPARTPCDRVVSLPTSHSPFFSRPRELVGALVAALDAFAERRDRAA